MDNVKKYTHSNFFTNRDNNTLIKEFEGILHHNPHICNLDAVVGFLRASGYFSLRPFLDNINKVRVLIGINVDKYIAQATRQGKIFFGAEEEVKEECLREIRRDIEHSHYSKEVENGMFQMVKDLIDGKLELRAHPSKKIHAKIYVLYPNDFNQYTQGMAITGSSNLTGNGLGITEERQYEFNVKMDRYDDVKFAKEEFELLWKEAEGCEITADDVKTSIDHTYLKGDASPYDLYIKMLMEYFSDRVMATDDNNPFDMPEGYKHFSKTKPMKVEHTLPIQEWWKDRKEIINDEVGEKSRVFTAQQLIDLDCNFDQCKFPKEEEEILPPAELLKQYFEKRAALDHEIDKTLSEIQKILGIDIKSCN